MQSSVGDPAGSRNGEVGGEAGCVSCVDMTESDISAQLSPLLSCDKLEKEGAECFGERLAKNRTRSSGSSSFLLSRIVDIYDYELQRQPIALALVQPTSGSRNLTRLACHGTASIDWLDLCKMISKDTGAAHCSEGTRDHVGALRARFCTCSYFCGLKVGESREG